MVMLLRFRRVWWVGKKSPVRSGVSEVSAVSAGVCCFTHNGKRLNGGPDLDSPTLGSEIGSRKLPRVRCTEAVDHE